MTMWLNKYLRQDSEKERANANQDLMEAGVHSSNMNTHYTGMGPCPASPRLQQQAPVPTSGFDPRAHHHHREEDNAIHDFNMSPMRLNFSVPATLRQDSILSVVSDYDSSLQSPTSITDRYNKSTSVYLDNDLNEEKSSPTSASTESLSDSRTSSKCWIGTTVTFGVLFAIVFALYFLTWVQIRRSSTTLSFNCVPCEHLVFSSDPLDDHTEEFDQRWEGTERVCCATNATQFERLINLITERKAKLDRSHGPSFSAHTSHESSRVEAPVVDLVQPSKSPPPVVSVAPTVKSDAPNTHAAHLYLNRSLQRPAMTVIREWTQDTNESAFVRKGVNFDHERGRLTVTEAGTFFIYLHLGFAADRDSPRAPKLFQTKIKKQGALQRTVVELFEDRQARRCDHNLFRAACHTVSLFGQVHLAAGDEIFVEVRNGQLLQKDKSSYFGLYRIE